MPAKPTLYLIDASSYLYRAFFALPPLTSPQGAAVNVAFGFTSMLLKLLRDTGATHIAAVFDAPGKTFRHDAFPEYKATRAATPDDLVAQIPLVYEVLDALRVRRIAVDGVEADDVIASLCERLANDAEVVVITADKDLMQIVGPRVRLWDTMRDRWCDVAEVERRMGVPPAQVVDVLGLMGDSVDNVPGVRGIGEKTAKALVQRFGSIETLLANLDALAAEKSIRGAKQLAARLREDPGAARLSRELVDLRRDVEVEDGSLEDFAHPGIDAAALRAFCLRLGFRALLRNLPDPEPAAAVEVDELADAAAVAAWARRARAAGQVALACEGSFARGAADLRRVVACVAADDGVAAIPGAAAGGLPPPLVALLRDDAVEKIAHDLKREMLVLGEDAAPEVSPAFDTMIASYLAEVAATHRLEDLATARLGRTVDGFRESPAGLAAGVAVLPALRDDLDRTLDALGLAALFRDVEMPLVGVLARMERRGVLLDAGALGRMGAEIDTRLAALEAEIHDMAGGSFNIGSPGQLREVLFERLGLPTKGVKRGKTGLSTDVDVLTKLADEHPLPARVLEHRSLAKLKSTYVDALPAAVNPATGRLHTSFNQTVAATGRLSSSDPNLQNIPVRTEEGRRIRAAFVAAEGCRFVGADYSQIELRLLAHMSQDPALLDAFRNDEDVHARTAAEVFGGFPQFVSAEQRRAAKVINFGILYGMGPQRLARELSIPLRQAQQYIEQYFARYSGVRAFMEGVVHTARETGFVTTLLGRRRSMPELGSQDRGVAQAAERTAANTPLQGSAADIIKLAMVAIDRRIRRQELAAAMLLQVHDELLFEVPEDEVDVVSALVREEMEGAYTLDVPLRVDVRQGKNWADVH